MKTIRVGNDRIEYHKGEEYPYVLVLTMEDGTEDATEMQGDDVVLLAELFRRAKEKA